MSNWKSKILKFGKYTWSEITAMVADGYIPVANADELDALRNTTAQTMGVGSIWEDTYTTGLDKKYIQINNIDLSNFENWNPLAPMGNVEITPIKPFSGIYLGNYLSINNLKIDRPTIPYCGLFGAIEGALLKGIYLNNVDIHGGAISGSIFGISYNSEIDNVFVNGLTYLGKNVTGSSGTPLIGIGSGTGGGFAGMIRDSTIITNSYVKNGNVEFFKSGNYSIISGFVGDVVHNSCVIKNCYYIGDRVLRSGGNVQYNEIGGFVGRNNGYILDCYCNCEEVRGTPAAFGIQYTGGFVGRNLRIIENSYSVTNVYQGITSRIFGFTESGMVVNSYYDREYFNRTHIGLGLPRTTAQMKHGTADSTVDGEAIYTAWDDAIWDFRTNLKYPKIRKL